LDDSDRSVLDLGLLMHGLLQEIKTANDIDSALQKLEFEGMVEPAEKDTLRALLVSLTQQSDTAFLFEKGWQVRNENDILLPDGKILRPDRVMVRQGQAIVVDYKTGLPNENHADQVQQYAQVLTQMGITDIKKYILYLRTNPADTFIQQVH
jgi:ATP-dependent exoDNAse (exonuclease V) beta subunit